MINVFLKLISVLVSVWCMLRFRWLVGLLSSSRFGCCQMISVSIRCVFLLLEKCCVFFVILLFWKLKLLRQLCSFCFSFCGVRCVICCNGDLLVCRNFSWCWVKQLSLMFLVRLILLCNGFSLFVSSLISVDFFVLLWFSRLICELGIRFSLMDFRMM